MFHSFLCNVVIDSLASFGLKHSEHSSLMSGFFKWSVDGYSSLWATLYDIWMGVKFFHASCSPNSSSNKTPKEYTSVDVEISFSARMCSGLWYAGVPCWRVLVPITFVVLKICAIPKSDRYAWNVPSTCVYYTYTCVYVIITMRRWLYICRETYKDISWLYVQVYCRRSCCVHVAESLGYLKCNLYFSWYWHLKTIALYKLKYRHTCK